MFKEYDVVIAKSNFDNVLKGTSGTILIIYSDQRHYEVEFVDNEGNTLNILTVNENEIELAGLDTASG